MGAGASPGMVHRQHTGLGLSAVGLCTGCECSDKAGSAAVTLLPWPVDCAALQLCTGSASSSRQPKGDASRSSGATLACLKIPRAVCWLRLHGLAVAESALHACWGTLATALECGAQPQSAWTACRKCGADCISLAGRTCASSTSSSIPSAPLISRYGCAAAGRQRVVVWHCCALTLGALSEVPDTASQISKSLRQRSRSCGLMRCATWRLQRGGGLARQQPGQSLAAAQYVLKRHGG